MLLRLVLILVASLGTQTSAFAQLCCGDPLPPECNQPNPPRYCYCTCDPQPECIVTIQNTQHLKDVLECYSFSWPCTWGGGGGSGPCFPYCPNGCLTEIIIPQGVEIELGGSVLYNIGLNCQANNLRITINGNMKWIGLPSAPTAMIQLNGAKNVVIRGSGKFYAPPSVVYDPESNAKLPFAIRILDGCNIEVDGLEFENIGSMVTQEGGKAHELHLKNLTGTKLWDYGIFMSDAKVASIENCHISQPQGAQGVYRFHGFHLYGDEITVYNCSAYQIARSGLWIVEGDDFSLDGLVTNSNLRIGPNFSCKDAGLDTADSTGIPAQRVRRVEIKNAQAEYVEVELGTTGAYLENMTVQQGQVFGSGESQVPMGKATPSWPGP